MLVTFIQRAHRAATALLAGVLAAQAAFATPASVPVDKDDLDPAVYEAWLRTPIRAVGLNEAPETHSQADGWPSRSGVPGHIATATGSIVELPVRTIAEWTPAMVRGALADADSGTLRTAADLVEAIMGDDRVQGVLSTRTHGLLGLPVNFYGAGDTVAQLEGTKALAGMPAVPGDWAAMFPEQELARLTAWGILLGVGLAERVPEKDRPIGASSKPRIRVWHPRWLRYQWDIDQWFLTTASGEIPITPGDGRWILYTPYGSTRPWALGAWRPISFAWVLKQFALHDRARHSEVLGSGARVGIAPQGADEGLRRRFLRDLRNVGRDNVLVVPEGWDYKVVEAQATARGDIYTTQIEWADKAIAVVLAGQSVTTEGTTGFSNGNIHNEIRLDLIQFTAETLAVCLHEQGVRHWANDNFGSPESAPFARWDTSPPEDKKANAEALSALGDAVFKLDAALAPSGRRVDAVELASKYGVPLTTAPTPQGVPPAPTAPPTPPSGLALPKAPIAPTKPPVIPPSAPLAPAANEPPRRAA